jgi:tetratricopeptide (TPR) repeat protein
MTIRTESVMQSFRIVAAVFMIILPAAISGQGVIETGTGAGVLQDSTGCPEKISLYKSARMNADPVAALGYWREALASCPAASEDIYADGELMYREMFEMTAAPEYIDTILMILTQRTYYFSNKPAHDLHKADLLLDLAGDDPEYLGLSYNILMEASESYPDQMECGHFVKLATIAASLYAMGIIDAGEMSNAFVTSIGTVDDRIESGTGSCSNSDDLVNMETFYRTSGAMTCSGLETLYSGKVDRNFRDTLFISKVRDMLTEAGCTGSDLYYNIAVKMFANDRSVANAVRLAELNLVRNDTERAISYFTEAYNRDTTSNVRSEVLIRVALMELGQGKRQEARDRAEHAFQLNKWNADALMLLAECYAGAELGSSFDNHTAYWVAVDYLEAAIKVDPSLRKVAEGRIRAYSKLFPTKEECFYRKILDEGTVFNVGGWVSEVTRVRFRKE